MYRRGPPRKRFGIGITATATAVVVGGNVQFTVNITGCDDPRVIWTVNGIVGGNAVVGTITAGGVYTAPAQAPPAPGIVTIRAESVGCPGLFAEQTLTIVGEWQTLASVPTPRGALVAETLADGIHAVGGAGTWVGSGLSVAHEVYDPATDTWAARAPAPDQNMWDPASAVVNGKLYVIGGWPSGSTLTREYDPLTDTWQNRAAIPTGFTWGHAAAVVGNQIYVIGGSDGPQILRYDPATDTWTSGLAPIPVNRTGLAAGSLGDKIYVVGTGSGLQIYDPLTDTWTQGTSLPVTTTAPSVAVLAGKLHVFGGSSSDPSTGGDLRTVQVYNPATDSWRLGAAMPTNRSWSAAAVHAGRAYVFGGLDRSNNAIAPNEQFSILTETATGTFQGPPGDFSTLIQNANGTFVRPLKDGTRINFNVNGLQTAAVDRNGNTTIYAYDADGRLTAVTDPAGRITAPDSVTASMGHYAWRNRRGMSRIGIERRLHTAGAHKGFLDPFSFTHREHYHGGEGVHEPDSGAAIGTQ